MYSQARSRARMREDATTRVWQGDIGYGVGGNAAGGATGGEESGE